MADPDSQPTPTQPAPDTKNATTSLILGIIAFVVPIIGFFTGIFAIVFWHKQKKIAPNGMATAGLILGILSIIAHILFFILIMVLLSAQVMSPDKMVPDRCISDPPFSCNEFRVVGDDATIIIGNNGGVDMSSAKMTIGCGYDMPSGTPIDLGPLVNGGSAQVSFSCPVSNGRFRAQYSIEYVPVGGSLPQVSSGGLQARAE